MEPMIENVLIRPKSADASFSNTHSSHGKSSPQRGTHLNGLIATGPIDRRSIVFAIFGAVTFFALGMFCLSISRFDAALASVWLPNGSALVILLLARQRNEIPFLIGILVASISANLVSGTPATATAFFTAANFTEVVIVICLVRHSCNRRVDLTDLAHLGRFLIYAGIVGPIASTAVSSFVFAADYQSLIAGASSWFLADSMGLILTIPAVLLIADAMRERAALTRNEIVERSVLMAGGLLAVYVVFKQESYPLLFLIPPITLLMAFRLGALGTALYVPCIAIIATWMTYAGFGPIVQSSAIDVRKVYFIQAFVAANFLTGLPIVAILTARVRLTQELLDGRAKLELLAENVTDAVLSIDRQGRCTYASASVRSVLGREPSDLIGCDLIERVDEKEKDPMASILVRLLNGECEKERFTYRRPLDAEDGSPVFIEADCAVAFSPETGRQGGVIVSARDITERVELELLLTRSRRHAEHAARAKSEFLANMSHEIRTPMNGVLGFAELMLQSDLNEEHRRHTEMIVQSSRSMMLLLNDILDLSKIEAGKITIDTAPVDLFATISECAVLHRPVAEKKGLQLVFNMPCADAERCLKGCQFCDSEGQRPWVETDALRLRQIILNLIANAIKFTENGKVEISYEVSDGEMTVEVRDTGIGISAARIKNIFAPFTQGENDTARRFGGTGLGLTISRQLAELLDGEITVKSEPGAGSTFRLRLPAAVVEPRFTASREAEAIEVSELPQSARILLVEDHDVNRMLGVEMLERCGQSVAIAQDGNEAIAMIIDSVLRDRQFDLVFMDIQMPGCDGYAAARTVRAEGIGPDVLPIIALTANVFPEDIAEARAAGMQAHLAKPLVFADLARALQRWLPTRIIDAKGSETAEDPDTADKKASQEQALSQQAASDGSARSEAKSATFVDSYAASTSISGLNSAPQILSPSLIERWSHRRSEEIEAVRKDLEKGVLSESSQSPDATEELARIVHRLAGTAAIFGEPDLGDQAAAFERALRQNLPSDVREALAFELLSVADDPADTLVPSAG